MLSFPFSLHPMRLLSVWTTVTILNYGWSLTFSDSDKNNHSTRLLHLPQAYNTSFPWLIVVPLSLLLSLSFYFPHLPRQPDSV